MQCYSGGHGKDACLHMRLCRGQQQLLGSAWALARSLSSSRSSSHCRFHQHYPRQIEKMHVMRGEALLGRAGPDQCFALDFDGVILDSEPEVRSQLSLAVIATRSAVLSLTAETGRALQPLLVSSSALGACAAMWPDKFGNLSERQISELRQGMRAARPVLVTGSDAMVHAQSAAVIAVRNSTPLAKDVAAACKQQLVQARLLLEDAHSLQEILHSWEHVLPSSLAQWRTTPEELSACMEQHRQELVDEDEAAWVKSNKLYNGLYDALRTCRYPWYAVTSKQPHRVSRLVQALLDMHWPEDSPRMFANCIPVHEKKLDALRAIKDKPLVKDNNATLHFVDDRVETVEAVAQCADLKDVQVYFADWGYSTEDDKRKAEGLQGVQTISLTDLVELLRWGIIMRTDDGCGDDN